MSIISNAKEIADLVKKLGDVELYRRIIELEGEIIELTRTNRVLEESVADLTKSLKTKEQLTWKPPFYVVEGDRFPFCSQCWDADRIAIHLKDTGNVHSGHRWDCPRCKNFLYHEDLI
jgi:ribosomal protein S27AE